MKAQRSSLTLIVLLLIALGLPNALAATKPKAAGRSATAFINTVLNGKGAPLKSLGIDGDFYIDTRSLLISGPKTKGKWPPARSMQGANGVNGLNGLNGSDGKNGNDAKNISTASTLAGPAGTKGLDGAPGAVGAAGAKGLDGAAGAKGADGANGVAGAKGADGAPGAAGAKGLDGANGVAGAKGADGAPGASGSAGAKGLDGANGANGANGAAGATGATGATGSPGIGLTGSTGATGATGSNGSNGSNGARGETGTVGPSEVTDIVIPTWTLQTATSFGFASSSGFGVLKAGKSYQISILMWGTTNSAESPYGVELLASSGDGPSYFYTVAPYRYAMTSTTSYKYGFSILGTITVGASDVSLSVKVIDGAGDTTSKPMVITGKALITLVGEVK